jgi:glycosyltransferase involved in cell wall biosynthesis
MDYHANISGVSHFVRDIFPLILRDRPSTRLLIVGKNPPASITGLASGNIVVTGAVDDVRPYLARAAVMVVPLLVGGGTRLKILEAMAAGRPVVSTSLGAEGLAVGPEQIVVRDEPDAFATAVVALLADADARERMSRAAHEFVANTYDWSTIVAGLNEAITDLVAEATLK